MARNQLDIIGPWSEAKLAILRSYAGAYMTVLDVPTPVPMRNSTGAVVYYLYFASPNKTGAKIVGDIFRKYRQEL